MEPGISAPESNRKISAVIKIRRRMTQALIRMNDLNAMASELFHKAAPRVRRLRRRRDVGAFASPCDALKEWKARRAMSDKLAACQGSPNKRLPEAPKSCQFVGHFPQEVFYVAESDHVNQSRPGLRLGRALPGRVICERGGPDFSGRHAGAGRGRRFCGAAQAPRERRRGGLRHRCGPDSRERLLDLFRG